MNSSQPIDYRTKRRGAVYSIQCTKTRACVRLAVCVGAVFLLAANAML